MALPTLRDLGDPVATRQAIYENALTAAGSIPAVANSRFSLAVERPTLEGPDRVTTGEHKKAVLRGETLSRPLKADWVLRDAAGGELGRRRSTLAHVPHLTDRGTFVVNGVEYTHAHQLRLMPGIYGRVKENGEVEGHANVRPGTGVSHRYSLDPETGVFKVHLDQSEIPAMPLLRAFGATDRDLRAAWGDELFQANAAHDEPSALDKLLKKVVRQFDPEAARAAKLKSAADVFGRMEFDPGVNRRTLGHPHERLDKAALLAVTRKLVALNKGEAEEDDRDHLAYQKVMGPEDTFAERFQRAGPLMRALLWKVSTRGDLDRVPANALGRHVLGALTDSGLGNALEEVSPLEILDRRTQITRMGQGGLSGVDTIPDSARNVHGSQIGFIDLTRTPECYDDRTEVMTAAGWKKWPDVTEADEFACLVDGALVFRQAERLTSYEYDGPLYGATTEFIDYLVTPNHRMWIRKAAGRPDSWQFELAGQAHGRRRDVMTGGFRPFSGTDPTGPYPPPVAKTANNMVTRRVDDLGDWAEFLGWYLSEGSFVWREAAPQTYRVDVSQCPVASPENRKRIEALLGRLPFTWAGSKSNPDAIHLSGKQLAAYCRQFGFCDDKFIPREFLFASEPVRRRLLEALLLGDGRRCVKGSRRGERTQFCTSSRRLAEDFHFLAFTLGIASRVVFEPDERQERYLGCYVVHLHLRQSRCIPGRLSPWTGQPYYRTEHYTGRVYCATVPGGLLYVRRGASVGFWCGNSLRAGVDLRGAMRVKKGSDHRLYTAYTDAKSGKEAWVSPQDLQDKVIGFPGDFDPKARVVRALIGGRIRYVPPARVDYVAPPAHAWFGSATGAVPFKQGDKGQRVSMGGRFWVQAMSLADPDAQLVSPVVPGTDRPYSEAMAKDAGAVFAVYARNNPGRVVAVAPHEIKVRYDDGTEHAHELVDNHVLNRKSILHNTPTVRVGDPVRPGQLLAHSNYTDRQGRVALGKNLRAAYMSWGGANFEDGIVISESAAKKLTSVHAYQHHLELADDLRPGKRAYSEVFPRRFERKALDALGDDGVVKPGAVVRTGDPLVVAVARRDPTHKSLYSGKKTGWDDRSLTWDHHNEGVVTDVEKTAKGILVVVKSHNPAVVADKLCYDPDTEVLTEAGWKPVAAVTTTDRVATLDPATKQFEYLAPAAVHAFEHVGRMYQVRSTQVDLLVTDNHKLYAKLGRNGDYTLRTPDEVFGREYRMLRSGVWQGVSPKEVVFPAVTVAAGQFGRGVRVMPPKAMPARTYLMVLGLYLSEGSKFDCPKAGNYGIILTQIKQPNQADMFAALRAAGLPIVERRDGAILYGLQYLEHFKQFGLCAEKFIPPEVFGWAKEDLWVLYEWLMFGDGHEGRTSHSYTTTSKQLADDFQRLCLHLGMSANIDVTPPTAGWIKGRHYKFRTRYSVRIYRSKNAPTINHGHTKEQAAQSEAWVDYAGTVHCVTMPRHHVIYVRRNGRPVWCGNSGLHGDKGVITEILPDDRMPRHPETKEPYDILLNPQGLISRGNAAQKAELWLGKIAGARGKPYHVTDFAHDDLMGFVNQEFAAHGLTGEEEVEDPLTGRKTTVATGLRHVLKLSHTSESKAQGRGLGEYNADGQPSKADPEASSKRFALMHVHAALGHGAYEVLRDVKLVRGQKNQEYWTAFMGGQKPPTPGEPFAYTKTLELMRAGGVHSRRVGSKTHLMALADRDVDELAGGRELVNANTVKWDGSMEPEKGGLFDPALTGGHGGKKYAQITLAEPMPNPAFEEPVRRLLGLTQKRFEAVLSGREKIGDLSGPKAIHKALADVSVDNALERAVQDFRFGRKSNRDDAAKRIGILQGLKKTGRTPGDLVLAKVPVLPPAFRPVSLMPSGARIVADPNYLYAELFDANRALKGLHGKVDDLSEERLNLYKSFKAVTGLGDPINPKNQEKGVRGLLGEVLGDSPKLGNVQFKLLGTPVDLVGRAVASVNPDLTMDEVGIPENKAWDVYAPFVIRSLVRKGFAPADAVKQLADRTRPARDALLGELKARPVMVDRAPVLHRYGMMAFYPRLVKGDAVQVSPAVFAPFNLDLDGDTINYHVPGTDAAAREAAEKMLPSRQLFHQGKFDDPVYAPRQEYLAGLYAATRGAAPGKRPQVFATRADMLRALRNGELGLNDPVEILS
jgi:DNA-directed RNA polymerase beta subunit